MAFGGRIPNLLSIEMNSICSTVVTCSLLLSPSRNYSTSGNSFAFALSCVCVEWWWWYAISLSHILEWIFIDFPSLLMKDAEAMRYFPSSSSFVSLSWVNSVQLTILLRLDQFPSICWKLIPFPTLNSRTKQYSGVINDSFSFSYFFLFLSS